jgi:hypothetical protein
VVKLSLESGLVKANKVSLSAENPTELLKAGSAAASLERIEALASLPFRIDGDRTEGIVDQGGDNGDAKEKAETAEGRRRRRRWWAGESRERIETNKSNYLE